MYYQDRLTDESDGVVLVSEQEAASYLVQMTSNLTSLSVTLEAKLILVQDRQVDRGRYY